MDRLEPSVDSTPTRWIGAGTAIVGVASVAYLLAFALPAWGGPAALNLGDPEEPWPWVEHLGWAAFLLAMFGDGGAGGRIAWIANPLLWVALVVHVVRRRRNLRAWWRFSGFLVGALPAGAVVLAIIGTLLFMADHAQYQPMAGFFIWAAAIAVAAVGLVIASTE